MSQGASVAQWTPPKPNSRAQQASQASKAVRGQAWTGCSRRQSARLGRRLPLPAAAARRRQRLDCTSPPSCSSATLRAPCHLQRHCPPASLLPAAECTSCGRRPFHIDCVREYLQRTLPAEVRRCSARGGGRAGSQRLHAMLLLPGPCSSQPQRRQWVCRHAPCRCPPLRPPAVPSHWLLQSREAAREGGCR